MVTSFFRPESKASTHNAPGKGRRDGARQNASSTRPARRHDPERARAEARALQERLREQESRFRARLAAISDEEVDAHIEALGESDATKLTRLARLEAARLGYYAPHEGSAVWMRTRRTVMRKLMAGEQDIGDIEWHDEEFFEEFFDDECVALPDAEDNYVENGNNETDA